MRKEPPAPQFPGSAAVVDGSEAIASVETRISEIACTYPITPSTTMAAIVQPRSRAGGRRDTSWLWRRWRHDGDDA